MESYSDFFLKGQKILRFDAASLTFLLVSFSCGTLSRTHLILTASQNMSLHLLVLYPPL